jgi:hypothetical protein
MKRLPEFKKISHETVLSHLKTIFGGSTPIQPSYIIDLIGYKDGHFRVVFNPHYFILPQGQTEPSKSQWNTLKKKFKRHIPNAFIFKEYGATQTPDGKGYYLDFGFFTDYRQELL